MSDDLIFACVRTGDRYPMIYVEKLRNMIARNCLRPYRMVCLTDRPQRCDGVEFIDISDLGLHGWWGKMALFRAEYRKGARVVFLDLDTIIIGDLDPLATLRCEFATCENFTRLAGNLGWPCKYNSSVMVIGEGWPEWLWSAFNQNRGMMQSFARYGDQRVIEELYPNAIYLQNVMPAGYFRNYRFLTAQKPHAAIINFGGSSKPDNCQIPWVQEAWQ